MEAQVEDLSDFDELDNTESSMDKNFFTTDKPPEPCLFETMKSMGLQLCNKQNSLSKYIIKEERHESSSNNKSNSRSNEYSKKRATSSSAAPNTGDSMKDKLLLDKSFIKEE